MRNIDGHPILGDDITTLQILGVNGEHDSNQTFASIINRIKPSSSLLSIIMELISFIQIVSIGFLSTSPAILDGSIYTQFISVFFRTAMDLSSLFHDPEYGNYIFLIIYFCLLIIWMIFFLIYTTKYKHSKNFHPFIINVLYYLGYPIFFALSALIGTNIGYFMRPIFHPEIESPAITTFASLAMFCAYTTIIIFMVKVVQSSPDVDIKNKFSFWPQNYIQPLYRSVLGLTLPFLLEIMRDQKGAVTLIISYVVILLCGSFGLWLLWREECNIFLTGRIVLATEYNILVLAPLLSIIYHYVKGNSLYYFFVFIIIITSTGVILSFVMNKRIKIKIDMLYSKFENLTALIDNPKDCMTLIKVGIIFNAPCVSNHTLLNWAVSRWPHDQPLLIFVSFIFYIIHRPYRDIIELVSLAAEISPFSIYDTLLLYQIFNRLPTHETQLSRKLEGIKHLYNLPRASLMHFWEAVLTRQWDEVVIGCENFKRHIDKINRIFQKLIFDNPSSECVMQEFIKFATEIQGNFLVAYAAQKVLTSRPSVDVSEQSQADGESITAISKLSSVKSSIFLSEFSENLQGVDKVQNGIQLAINARPIFWPMRFFVFIFLISVISLAIVIITFILSYIQSNRLDNQVKLASTIQQMSIELTKILFASIEFITHNLTASNTVTGQEFNYSQKRKELNELSNTLDELISSSFMLHHDMPYSFLRLWVTEVVTSNLLMPIDPIEQNISLISVIRLFEIKARTLAFSPVGYIGSIENPSPEILEISYLFPAALEVTSIMSSSILSISSQEIDDKQWIVLLSLFIGLVVNLIVLIITLPITIYGIKCEFEFFFKIYASIPLHVVKDQLRADKLKIGDNDQLAPQNQQTDFEDTINTQLELSEQANLITFKNNKQKVPLRLYHTGSIVIWFLVAFLIIPLPVVFTVVSYINHGNELKTILNNLYLSIVLTSNIGELYLRSFELMTDFPTMLNHTQKLTLFSAAANSMLSTYSQIFFEGHHLYLDNLLGANESCPQLIGSTIIRRECTTLHSDIYFIYGLADRMIQIDFNNVDETGITSTWWRLFYSASSSLVDKTTSNLFDIFSKIMIHEHDQNVLFNILGLIFSIVFFIFVIIFVFIFIKFVITSSIRSLTAPIQVMDIESISESNFLLRFLQGDFDNASRQILHESKNKKAALTVPLIDFLLEGVIVMNAEGTVLATNKKYHEMMGNTADEIIGRNITSLFPNILDPLFEIMNSIKNGNQIDLSSNNSIDTTLFTEDDHEIHARIYFAANLGHEEHGDKSTTCALIIIDRSEYIKTQNLLRKEKQTVESLLYTILPPKIASSLLNGQNEISFEVESATIFHLNIHEFLPTCSQMNGKQIMAMLNFVFAELDAGIQQFQRITKLKTIGDEYICSSGICKGDGTKEECATDIVSYACHILNVMPNLNNLHNTNIHLRIGIYTGGPLICGVLGKDKPVFEVLGKGVGIAKQLQLTAPADKIQISQSTESLIRSMNLQVTEKKDLKILGIEEEPTFIIG